MSIPLWNSPVNLDLDNFISSMDIGLFKLYISNEIDPVKGKKKLEMQEKRGELLEQCSWVGEKEQAPQAEGLL